MGDLAAGTKAPFSADVAWRWPMSAPGLAPHLAPNRPSVGVSSARHTRPQVSARGGFLDIAEQGAASGAAAMDAWRRVAA